MKIQERHRLNCRSTEIIASIVKVVLECKESPVVYRWMNTGQYCIIGDNDEYLFSATLYEVGTMSNLIKTLADYKYQIEGGLCG